jgi:hypothetical protein
MPTGAPIKNYWREEFVLLCVLLLFFLAIVGFAVRLPFDARLFPLVIGSAGILLMLAIAAAEIRRRRDVKTATNVIADDDPAANSSWPRYATALLSAPVFGLVFWLFGFFVASVAAMLLMPPLMGYSNRRLIFIVGAATVLVLALFFPYLVGVSLPHGLVGDWLIDLFRST